MEEAEVERGVIDDAAGWYAVGSGEDAALIPREAEDGGAGRLRMGRGGRMEPAAMDGNDGGGGGRGGKREEEE